MQKDHKLRQRPQGKAARGLATEHHIMARSAQKLPPQTVSPLGASQELGDAELIICGRHAVLARYKTRPQTIIRAYVSEQTLPVVKGLLADLAARRRSYHIVNDKILEKVSGTQHHEGIAVLVKQAPPLQGAAFRAALAELHRTSARQPLSLLVLDGIENALNIGAITRVAAHFGACGVLLLRRDGGAGLESPTFFRTAAGGAEAQLLFGQARLSDAARVVADLEHAGWGVFGTTSHKDILQEGQPQRRGGSDKQARVTALGDIKMPHRVAFVLGSESFGHSAELRSALKSCLTIPGTGAVESLNVACAASVLLAEWARQSKAAPNSSRPALH